MAYVLALFGLVILWVFELIFITNVRFDEPPYNWTRTGKIVYLLTLLFLFILEVASVASLTVVVLHAVFSGKP